MPATIGALSSEEHSPADQEVIEAYRSTGGTDRASAMSR